METKDPTPIRADINLVPNKAGILIPEDQVKPPCQHPSVVKRVGLKAQQVVVYMCRECKGRVHLKITGFALVAEADLAAFDAFMAMRAQEAQATQRRKQTGLVLPSEK